MQTLTRLSNAANRVNEAMQTLAHATRTGVTIKEIMHTSGMGYSSVCGALSELQRNNIISKQSAPKRSGTGYVYKFENLDYLDYPDNPDFQKAALCTPHATISLPVFKEKKKEKEEEENARIKKIFESLKITLGEFVDGEYIEPLARFLMPKFIAADRYEELIATIKQQCVEIKNTPNWKFPSRVIFKKLRAWANDQQDPLPVFKTYLQETTSPPQPKNLKRPAKKSGSYRRTQVESTDADRAADELAAAQIRAELRARRLKAEATA